MGVVKAVCISEKKGTAKKNVGECRFIEEWGLENDAHAGNWHRQVSLLSFDEVEKFRTALMSELSDVMWMVAEIATLNGLGLDEIMEYNIVKLTDRRSKGLIDGSGDTIEERVANSRRQNEGWLETGPVPRREVRGEQRGTHPQNFYRACP